MHSIIHISYVISLLINFIEDYEIKTNEFIQRDGFDSIFCLINTEKADEILFTTNDMLTRVGNCLLSIMICTDNMKKNRKTMKIEY